MASAENSAGGGSRIPYLCLPGSRFTGSTLLGSLLGEHPDCASIGAAVGLIRRTDLTTYQCSCGELFLQCEFWSDIAARTKALGYPVNVFETNFWNTHLRLSKNRVLNGMLARPLGWDSFERMRDTVVMRAPGSKAAIARMGWNTWSLARAVLDRTGKSVFVDTARDHQRPKYLFGHPMLDVKVVHLVRDPRGNAASIVKHTGVDMATAAKQWKHSNVEAARIKRYLPEDAWMSLRYEELCADPAGVLDRIVRFMGLSRPMVRDGFGNRGGHIIGNKMRMRALTEIREDLAWRDQLSPADLATIARIAGPASHSFGYTWP